MGRTPSKSRPSESNTGVEGQPPLKRSIGEAVSSAGSQVKFEQEGKKQCIHRNTVYRETCLHWTYEFQEAGQKSFRG